jgi:HEAT repeat protein
VIDVLDNPALFSEVFKGILSDDPLIRMRSADAVEKITAKRPQYLQDYKRTLIYKVAKIDQQEVRWHVAQMLSRLALTKTESEVVVEILMNYLLDKSGIVRTFSMQALADIAAKQKSLRPQIVRLLKTLTKRGTPAMQNRERKLLEKIASLEDKD